MTAAHGKTGVVQSACVFALGRILPDAGVGVGRAAVVDDAVWLPPDPLALSAVESAKLGWVKVKTTAALVQGLGVELAW